MPERITTPVRNAGIFHVATGTWTRVPGAAAQLGPDVVYSNTAPSGYFSTAGGQGSTTFLGDSRVVDEGGLPGAMNGLQPNADRDSYSIDGFEISYCDFSTTPRVAGWTLGFYDSYVSCMSVDGLLPRRTIQLSGLPSNGCWTLVIDLEGSGDEFCMVADGGDANPGWQNFPDLDSFGWSYSYNGTGIGDAGFVIAGDPRATDIGYVYSHPGPAPGTAGETATAGTETYFGGASLCGPGVSTGFLTQDRYRVDDLASPMNTGCYYFLGYANLNGPGVCGPSRPFSAFHLELYAQPGECLGPLGVDYCSSTANSTGVQGRLAAFGLRSASADAIRLEASSLPPFSFGFLLTSLTQDQVVTPPGSVGILCLGGGIGRFVAPGQIMSSGPSGAFALDTTAGQWTVNAIPSPTGPYAAMAGITTSFQGWFRDSFGGPPVSNFTNGHAVTWLP
ncbi:MAG: hypothetical protein AAGA20_02885 [Planctomycetota bacterium]